MAFFLLSVLLTSYEFRQDLSVDDCAAGVESRIQSLRKGVFSANRRHSLLNAVDRSLVKKREEQIFCAFDFDLSRFRFDRTAETDFYKLNQFPKGVPDGLKAIVKPRATHHLVQGPEDSIHAVDYGDHRVSHLTIQTRDARVLMGYESFDARIFGLCSLYHLETNVKAERLIKNNCDLIKRGRIERLPGGIVKIRIVKPLFREYWIDVGKNFVPVRMEEANPGPVLVNPQSPPVPNTVCTFDWLQVDNQWVPSAARMESRDARKNQIEVYEYSFEWKQVGEPVASVLFTPEGLGMPEKTPISDLRLGAGNSVAVGRLGPSAVPPDFNVPAETELGGGKGSRIIEVLIGLAVVAAVAGLVWYWRKRAGTRTG